MKEEIREVIEKNLPAEVGNVLKENLAELEVLRSTVLQKEEVIERFKDQIMANDRQMRELEEKLSKCAELMNREGQIELREREMKVFEAGLKVIEAEKRADAVTDIVKIVFRSPVFTKYINSQKGMITEWDQNLGMNVQVPDGSKNTTETTHES